MVRSFTVGFSSVSVFFSVQKTGPANTTYKPKFTTHLKQLIAFADKTRQFEIIPHLLKHMTMHVLIAQGAIPHSHPHTFQGTDKSHQWPWGSTGHSIHWRWCWGGSDRMGNHGIFWWQVVYWLVIAILLSIQLYTYSKIKYYDFLYTAMGPISLLGFCPIITYSDLNSIGNIYNDQYSRGVPKYLQLLHRLSRPA